MESNWAVEHLQVIRTLMERSALYRRALAPIMIYNGVLGVAGAVLGWGLKLDAMQPFILLWAGICAVAITGSLLMVRRQALRAAEPFWSPPTRRVTEAFLPPLTAGFILTAAVFWEAKPLLGGAPWLWLPAGWVVLYGCALHASGFFMPRGTRWFGWGFVFCGSVLLGLSFQQSEPCAAWTHGAMGFFFGVLHLAYGVYLYFTEQGTNAA